MAEIAIVDAGYGIPESDGYIYNVKVTLNDGYYHKVVIHSSDNDALRHVVQVLLEGTRNVDGTEPRRKDRAGLVVDIPIVDVAAHLTLPLLGSFSVEL